MTITFHYCNLVREGDDYLIPKLPFTYTLLKVIRDEGNQTVTLVIEDNPEAAEWARLCTED